MRSAVCNILRTTHNMIEGTQLHSAPLFLLSSPHIDLKKLWVSHKEIFSLLESLYYLFLLLDLMVPSLVSLTINSPRTICIFRGIDGEIDVSG